MGRLLGVALAILIVAGTVAPPAPAHAQPRPDGAPTLRAAYDALFDRYIDPLSPAGLLGEAWTGMAASLAARGITAPPLPVLPDERQAAWRAFEPTFRAFEQATAGVATSTELAYSGIRSMTAARDECHTYFLTPVQVAELQQSLSGSRTFVGIGIQRSRTTPYTIVRVYPGSPAERANLRAGDIILAADGTPLGDLTPAEAGALLTGPTGSTVVLRIQRGDAVYEVAIVRAAVSIPLVSSRLLPGNIGYVELTSFTLNTESYDQVRAALLDLEAQGATAWILDVRGNSGGATTALYSLLGLLLPRTRALTFRTRDGIATTAFTTGQPLPMQRPLAVLTGPGSASAAELMAAVLQDTGRARIIGERTAGCANAGQLRTLPDGAAVLVTSARLLAGPSERQIDGEGLAPDDLVTATADGTDAALNAAIAHLERAVPARP